MSRVEQVRQIGQVAKNVMHPIGVAMRLIAEKTTVSDQIGADTSGHSISCGCANRSQS
jgi:hypothetical protein